MRGVSGESRARPLMPNHATGSGRLRRWAKARGCIAYDLWGIPDEVGDDPDAYAEPEKSGEGGLWGVYRFKQGFGGQVVRYTGAWGLPLSNRGMRCIGWRGGCGGGRGCVMREAGRRGRGKETWVNGRC